jgi:phage tail-like protein
MAKKIDSPLGESPAIARNFTVAIDDVEIGFCSLSRLASETVREEPARAVYRYPNVVLCRALGRDRRLFEWRERILAGKEDKRQVTICQLDGAGGRVTSTWILEGAWPCRWAGPAFDANAGEVAMEEIELAYDRLVWR